MLVTVYQNEWMTVMPLDAIRTDPTRMAQGIMTGIGFLGAGVIFKEGLTVRGLTTAASIWITAAIGILIGIGLERIEVVTDEIETLAKSDGSCRRVMTVPGIGPIISSAMVAAIGSGDRAAAS